MSRLLVIDYGFCNLDSVYRAVQECGGDPFISDDPARAATAERMILPGVGSFAEAMKVIRRRGSLERERHLGDVIQAAIEAGLVVQSVSFPSGSFIDIGAPDRLLEIWRRSAEGAASAEASPDSESGA